MNNIFYNTLALKKIRRSISITFAGIYEVLVFTNRSKASVMLHTGVDIVAIAVNTEMVQI